jgi:DNA-binding NarL/FixJ family response regulator
VFLAPYALARLGEAHLAAGDRAAARDVLREAFAQADAHGVGLVRQRVEAIAAAAGLAVHPGATAADDDRAASRRPQAAPTPSGEPAGLVQLTARERQVLDLIAQGLSNRQIGERLFISGKTASVHVSAILRKLGASTRTEAAVRAGALR